MAHLKNSATRAENTPTEWLGVGRTIGELANKWSLRGDLVAYVGTDAGHGAPACYNPALAEIEVDTAIAFGKITTPEMIGDLSERSSQYEFPKATGAIMHEAFHARFSNWDLASAHATLQKDEYEALNLLEEGRIEAQGLLAMPNARVFLRACAMDIVINDATEKFAEGSSTQSAAMLVGLVHSRIAAGVLDYADAYELTDLVNDYLGEEIVSKLVEIARKAQAHSIHNNAEEMYPLAIEWAKIVREVAKEKGDDQPKGSGCFPMKEILEALGEMAESVEIANNSELLGQEESEEWAEKSETIKKKSKEISENKTISKEVFSKREKEAGGKSSSTLVETRKPTSQERSAAVKIAQMLEKAKYRERDVTEVHSILPPGRLRTSALVQGAALKARGVMEQTEAWRRTVRKHTDDPILTVGVMVDISGSMGSAMKPMATTAWVMSEAVKRVQGRCAMVYYGNDVFATLKPGQHLSDVKIYSASDGTEKFDKAFRALDGALNLLNSSGAKLLVVVSDGQYTDEETEKAKKWVARCAEAGVAVLWLPFDDGRSASRIASSGRVAVLSGVLDPASSAVEIGKSAAELLTNVGRRVA